MPKDPMRGHTDDVYGLAQWLGRKCRNHNPMKERVKARGAPKVGLTPDHAVIYALPNGRRFEIAVREVDPEEKVGQLIEVGY